MVGKGHNIGICKLCGKEHTQTSDNTGKHSSRKGKTNEEFYGKERAEEISNKLRVSAQRQHQDPAYRKAQSDRMSGRILTEEHKRGISEGNKGPRAPISIAWYEIRKKVRERANNKCEICGVSEEELLGQGKRRLMVHEKNYDKTIPTLEDCVLCCPSCHAKEHGTPTTRNDRQRTVTHAVLGLLKSLNIDITNSNFLETPRRFASVLLDFSGLETDWKFEAEEMYDSIFEHDGEGLIAESGITTYTLCPHHLLPVKYTISLAYLPKGYAIGLSKLSRLCELLAKDFQLQERYTKRIADSLVTYLKTPDIVVVTLGEHWCMRMRGVKDPNSQVIVSEMRGDFRESHALRMEVLSLLGLRNV